VPRLRLVTAFLAVLASLALVACGGDTDEKNDYVDQVNEVTTTLNSGLSEISADAPLATDPSQASKVFSQFAASLETAASDIDAIEPPGDVGSLHDKLVSDVTTLSDEATNAANEAEAGGPASLPGVATQFIDEANRLSGDIDATIAEINTELQS
jgi:hypothetical protein